ncbi:uncharacterized protein [Eurosta solidaginis]|uniref:uncharacterized protein n=1 Tax=Eurosta solidaginis TaxID=178769 RepID=UPI003530CDE4
MSEIEQADTDGLVKLLNEFNLPDVLPYLTGAHVTLKSLQYMRSEDIKEAIPPLGLRIEFREKLFMWKKREYGIDDDTISVPSTVGPWLETAGQNTKHILKKDYYFIPRQGKNNPSGKLYSKYKNLKSKRRKIDGSSELSESPDENYCSQPIAQTPEVDESVTEAYKTSLNRDGADWVQVCEKWKKTFQIRQRDLHNMSPSPFFQASTKFAHAQAADLIEIDLQFIYPEKTHLLLSKWETFKTKIFSYYKKNTTHKYCRQLLSTAKSSDNKDIQDYLFTILLNSVLPCSSRFKSESGKKTKKVTIVDSQESLVLRLTTLNDYQRQVNAVINKYYSAGLTIQPFLIVEGLSDTNINSFLCILIITCISLIH